MGAPTKAEAAVTYMLRRIRSDGKLAFLLLYTEAWERLTEAEAERLGEPVEKYRETFLDGIRTTRVIEDFDEGGET